MAPQSKKKRKKLQRVKFNLEQQKSGKCGETWLQHVMKNMTIKGFVVDVKTGKFKRK